jgi:hypothetical protein
MNTQGLIDDESLPHCEYIGDFNPDWPSSRALSKYRDEEESINIERAMFRLEQNDSSLTTVIISDSFISMGGHGNTAMFDVLQAIYSHNHIRQLCLVWSDISSTLWNHNIGRPALTQVLHDNTSITNVKVITFQENISTLGDVLQHCQQLTTLHIEYTNDALPQFATGAAAFTHYLHKLPFLEDVVLENISVLKHDAIAISQTLCKKTTMKKLRLWQCDLAHEGASVLVDALKTEDCSPFTEVALFSTEFPFPSYYQMCRQQWQTNIDMKL